MTSPNDWLTALALAMMRPLGLSLFFPLLHARSLGSSLLRNAVLLALILPILPLTNWHTLVSPSPDSSWIILIIGEIAIGMLLGFCAAIPFWAVDMAGFLIDTLRGATMSSVFNPNMGEQTSIFGLFFSQLLCVLFLLTGDINLLLSTLYDSYQTLPPGKALMFNQPFFDFLRAEWQMLYRLCLGFSLPAVLCMVLVDLALGLLNRSAPQLNVFFLSMPIKSALVLLLLILVLAYAFDYHKSQSDVFYWHLHNWLSSHE